MQILPNCLYVVAHRLSKTTVCVEGMHKSCYEFSLDLCRKTIALTWCTGVISKLFVIKSCRNPARHIFSWLPGEAVGLHMGVLTKTFAMSVLYLKSELNCGWAPLMERMQARQAAMEVKGHASQWACVAYISHASQWACTFEDSLHASRLAYAPDGACTPPVQSRSSSCPHGTSYSH